MPDEDARDYLPARMLNEFVYCPRLYFYEHVEGVFKHNRETVEGALRHTKVDSGKGELAPAEELSPEDAIHARSVTLSSERHGLIAKMDLIEADDGVVVPVDYKRGSPRELAPGKWKFTACPAPTEKLFQLMTARSLCCVTSTWLGAT